MQRWECTTPAVALVEREPDGLGAAGCELVSIVCSGGSGRFVASFVRPLA